MKKKKYLLLVTLLSFALVPLTGCESEEKTSDIVVDIATDIIKGNETGVVEKVVTDAATDIVAEIIGGSAPEAAIKKATENAAEQVSNSRSLQTRLLFWVVFPLLVALAYRIYNVRSAHKTKLEKERLHFEEHRMTGREYLNHILKYDYSFACNYKKAGDRDIQVRNEIDGQFESGQLSKEEYRSAVENMAR